MTSPADRARAVAEELAIRWNLKLGVPLPLASCSLVLEAWQDDVPLILKVPHDGSEEATSAWALRAFEACGGIETIATEDDTGASLMPRLGGDLAQSDLSEERRVTVCAELIRAAHSAPIDFRALDVATWFAEPPADAPAIVRDAWRTVRRLIDTAPPPVMLHGDLHHFNILQAPTGWRFIDPKGMAGDPAFEPSAYLRNPVGALPADPEALASLMRQRLRWFAELLPYPPERMWGWAFAQTTWCGNDCSPGPFRRDWQAAAQGLWETRAEFVTG